MGRGGESRPRRARLTGSEGAGRRVKIAVTVMTMRVLAGEGGVAGTSGGGSGGSSGNDGGGESAGRRKAQRRRQAPRSVRRAIRAVVGDEATSRMTTDG